MGNHRADRGARRTSVSPLKDPSRAKGGARRAPRHGPATGADIEMTARAATVDPHTEPQAITPSGRWRVRGSRSPYVRRMTAIPALTGLATIAVAAIGATTTVSMSAGDAPAAHRLVSQVSPANALTGTTGDGNTSGAGAGGGADVSGRGQIVSRSGSRGDQRSLLKDAKATVEKRDRALAQIAADSSSYAEEVARNAWVLPTSGYRLTAGFGESSGLWSSTHTGLDMATDSGTPIVAVAGGTVTETGYDGSYGNKTVITLDDGTEIWFCHQTSILVSVGDVVRSGEQIGTVGSTGNSTGPHLHLEVRPGGGDPVDPYSALVEHGVQP